VDSYFFRKAFACKKKRLTAKKSVKLQKKPLGCNFFLPAIFSKADVKALASSD
jgi:hypothetical protein